VAAAEPASKGSPLAKASVSASQPSAIAFLAGPGEMATRIRAFDWAGTPLDAPSTWRPALRTMVRMMLTTQHPVFIFWGPEHTCLYNDAYSASIGPEKHPAILGMPGRQAWPEIWSTIGPQIEMVLRGEGATWHENQHLPIFRHGQLTDVYWTYSFGPIDEEQAPNGVGGVLVLCTETTEQVLTARRLKAEREGFAELFEQAPTFMALLRGPEHVFELANPGYLRLVGHRAMLGLPVAKALPEAEGQGYLALLDEVYRSGKAYTAIASKLALQGALGSPPVERYLDFVYQPITDAEGTVTGIFVEGVDVTDRRSAEQALRLSEDRLRMAVESSSLGTFDVELSTGHVEFSENARQMFGLLQGPITLQRCLQRVHPGDVAIVQEALHRAEAGDNGGVYRLRHRVIGHADGERTVSVSGRALHDEQGLRLMGVVWDVTEQERLVDALHRADRRKDEFLATLAHELRNPLAAVRTAATLLSRPELAQSRLAWCSELIERQSSTMAALLDDLLEVARITSGKLELKKESVTLGSVVNAALETARPGIDEKAHVLSLHVADEFTLLEVDAIRVSQVLTNLLTNAAKYTDAGGRIALKAWVEKGEAFFEVIDNGIGLSVDTLPAMFEMFQQFKGSLDRSQGGLGIGLAVSKGLVELHGGRISAASDGPGTGSVFRVVLPVGAPRSSAADAGVAPEAGVRVPPDVRVLIADDNVDAAKALAELLEMDGYRVDVAYDGQQALDMAMRIRPVAGFLDIGMPLLDGYQLAARLRAQPDLNGMLLVAMTGWGQEADKRAALAAGFDAHLTKPIDPAEVAAMLAGRLAQGPTAELS
jgi:PAS domain S-box-containing protein